MTALLATVAALVLSASCGAEEPTASPVSDKLGTSMLELIEFDGSFADITFADIAVAAELEDIEMPSPGQPVGPFAQELMSRGAMINYGLLGGFVDDPALWPPVLGVEPAQVAASMSVVTGPFSAELLVPIEPISLDDIEVAALQDRVWSPELMRVETSSGDYLDWDVDDNRSDMDKAGGMRPLGRGGQVGVAGGTVVWSASHEYVEQALAAQAGEVERLADADLVVELLAGFDGPPPQAFIMRLDPGIDKISIVMNVPGDTGYEAVLLALDPGIDGIPQLPPALADGAVDRVGSVTRIRMNGTGGYDTLIDCLFAETCFGN